MSSIVLWQPEINNLEANKVLDDLVSSLENLIPNLSEANQRITAMAIIACQKEMVKHPSIDAKLFMQTIIKTLNENEFSISYLDVMQDIYVNGLSK